MLARFGRCLLRRAQGRYEEALTLCRTFVLGDDLYRRPLTYKEIGFDYLYLGKPDQAITAFNASDQLLQDVGVRWMWLFGGGFAYLHAGRYEEAIEWLRQALEVRPRMLDARVWLIAAYALSGRQQDATTELSAMQRATPDFFSRDDALAGIIKAPGSPAFAEQMRRIIEGLEKGGFPERMTKPLLAKSLAQVGSQNSPGGSASQ